MQRIFFNGNIVTFDKNNPHAEAVLINDGNIVLVGKNDEILSMKTDEIVTSDLEGKTLLPSFYDTNASIYKLIEENLKKSGSGELENNDEIDLNYEKFDHYETYKNEFLKIQDEYLKLGITTIFEMNICSKEFTFLKKLSEDEQIKIDIIGYVRITSDKDIMDNNCKSYRKYRNHFRLGGYYIAIDGKLYEKRAWLSKHYSDEKTYVGYSYVLDEQLSILIKNVLQEKKQFVVETNGDNSLEQFFRCFEENIKDKEDYERFRPIAKNCNFISKNHLKVMKELGISPSFQIKDIKNYGAKYKKSLGFRSLNIQPVSSIIKNEMRFLINSSEDEIPNIFEMAKIAEERKIADKKVLGKKHRISFEDALKSLICDSAYFAFDWDFKGSVENGKKADFVILNSNLEKIKSERFSDVVFETIIEGETVWRCK